jgi:hypothetical protein
MNLFTGLGFPPPGSSRPEESAEMDDPHDPMLLPWIDQPRRIKAPAQEAWPVLLCAVAVLGLLSLIV